MTQISPSIDAEEVEKFSKIAEEWWDERGKFRPLHRINPVRIGYVRDKVAAHYGRDVIKNKPFDGLSFVDVGCGGGLLSEPLARLGGQVTGIDASEKNIRTASYHAQQTGVSVNYQCRSVESLAEENAQFDVVLAMEVVEHVADVEGFLQACCQIVKPGGLIVVSTLNKTVKSYLQAIIGAEYLLRWLPRGTHDWKKFLPPSTIAACLRQYNVQLEQMKGLHYSPLNDEWSLSENLDVNYMMVGVKSVSI